MTSPLTPEQIAEWRGNQIPPRYYLAECQECGKIMPSSRLIESRNVMDGDADVYCPHCNANDCDIDDLGAGDAPAVKAWNLQQKRIEALLDALDLQIRTNREMLVSLDAKDKRIAEQDREIDSLATVAGSNAAQVKELTSRAESAERENARQRGIILSARKFVSDIAGLGDVGAAEFMRLLDEVAGISLQKGEE